VCAQVRPDCWFVHHDVAASVDAMLAGQHPEVEVRTLDHLGRVQKTPLEYAEEPASVPRFEVRQLLKVDERAGRASSSARYMRQRGKRGEAMRDGEGRDITPCFFYGPHQSGNLNA